MNREYIEEYLMNRDESVLLADGFDEALLGFSQRINEPLTAVYSYRIVIETLMNRDGMSREDAEEYAEFNILGSWVGPQTPIFVMPVGWES